MIECSTSSNLFKLSDNKVNSLKKTDLVQQIFSIRMKIIVDSTCQNLRDQISDSFKKITKLATTNLKS